MYRKIFTKPSKVNIINAALFVAIIIFSSVFFPFFWICKKLVRARYLCITTGGTGGHVIPAQIISKAISQHNVYIVTDSRGVKYLSNVRYFQIAVRPLSKILNITYLLISIFQTIWIVMKNPPEKIIGFGGYASFPMLFIGAALKIPIILHEQNAIAGFVTSLFERYSCKILITFPQTKGIKNAIVTGLPIRDDIANNGIKMYETMAKKPYYAILIISGSGGAKFFSGPILEAILIFSKMVQRPIIIYHQAKNDDLHHVEKFYKDNKIPAIVQTFFPNIPDLLSDVSLVISRAGASSIVETLQSGVPGIFIPLPNAKNDHQNENIKALKCNGNQTCISFDEKSIAESPYKLAVMINSILESQSMYESLSRMGRLFFNQMAKDIIVSHIV